MQTFFLTLLAIFFSLFAVLTMSITALATPLGPWIEIPLAIIGVMILRLFQKRQSTPTRATLAYALSAGGVAGAVATAAAFTLPTLYFLDPSWCISWCHTPLIAYGTIGILILAAGSLGFLLVIHWGTLLLACNGSFPIPHLITALLTNPCPGTQRYGIGAGAFGTALYTLLIQLLHAPLSLPLTAYAFPLFGAIGFSTGSSLARPLISALMARWCLLEPIRSILFPALGSTEYLFGVGTGLTLYALAQSTYEQRHYIKKMITLLCTIKVSDAFAIIPSSHQASLYLLFLSLPLALLRIASFSYLAQAYLIGVALLSGYQLMKTGTYMGIAPVGRYATFALIPALAIFSFTYTQIVIVSAFVELVGISAVSILFGQKLAQLHNLCSRRMAHYQALGLLISGLSVGALLLFLMQAQVVGTPFLFALRAQHRSALIQSTTYAFSAILLGTILGFVLHRYAINTFLFFTGLVMHSEFVLIMSIGNSIHKKISQKNEWYPFCAGIYTASIIALLIRLLGTV